MKSTRGDISEVAVLKDCVSTCDLAQSGLDFGLLCETLSDLVCTVSDGKVVLINSAGVRLLGANAAEDVLGTSLVDYLAPEYRMLFQEAIEQMLAECDPLPAKLLRIDGTTLDSVISLSVRADRRRQNEYFFIARDISDLKEASTRLVDRERRLAAIAQNVADALVTIHRDGRIESFNLAAERIFGYAAAEVIGEGLAILFPVLEEAGKEDYFDQYLPDVQTVIPESGLRELTGLHKDGSEVLVEVAGSRIEVDGEEFLTAAMRDITGRKRAEEALRASEQAYSGLLSNLPGLVYSCHYDRGRTDQFASPGCEALTGYSPSAFDKGEISYIETIHPEDRDQVCLDTQAAVGEKRPYELTYRIVTKSNETKWVWDKGNCVSVAGQKPAIIEGFITDITEQKGLEQQVQESQKLAALGELSGGVAHDFNNLLMIIGGYSAVALANSNDQAKVEHSLSKINTATEQAARLTAQLLAFSRRQVLKNQTLCVRTILEELETLLRPLLGETIFPTFDAIADDAYIEADSSQISQVLINLAINARDAMPNGGGIRFSATPTEVQADDLVAKGQGDPPLGTYVLFTVQDDGTGMDQETVQRIFEPFFTTKEQGKGTGLGLSMAYGFAQQSGGFIDVESTLGEGTTFKLYLPLVEAKAAAALDLDEKTPAGKGEIILLVEDADDIRQLLETVLGGLGYTILTATNGFEAMEVDSEHDGKIDLVLSDVVMPVIGGFELADLIQETRPETKVMLMTGYPDRSQLRPSKRPETIPMLAKPLTPTALAHSVRDYLDGKSDP